MPFEALDVLEVPPLPSLQLEQPTLDRDQLVSSTFLTSASSLLRSPNCIKPLSHDLKPGTDPVLDAFANRNLTTSSTLHPQTTMLFR